jgi:hypothetical protein
MIEEGKAVPCDLALVRSQLEMCKANATHGNLFFSLAYLNDELIKTLAQDPFSVPARPWYPEKRSAPAGNR